MTGYSKAARCLLLTTLAAFLVAVPGTGEERGARRPRARDIGIEVGILAPGPLNAITDVAGVRVGHRTVDRGESVRTGVTAIVPHGGNCFREKVPAAAFVANGFGKAAGLSQIDELGLIETPIVLTSTLNVPEACAALIEYTLALPGNDDVVSVNPVVGETNDSQLNDIRSRPLSAADVLEAIRGATEGPVAEGSVGAGRGTVCFGWKGGIGTASRVVRAGDAVRTVGVLVQTNFGGILQMNGAPVGRELGRYDGASLADTGSCMIVVATDAPLEATALRRIAKRAVFALARTGAIYSNGSGDYAIAFSSSAEMRVRIDEPARPRAPLAAEQLTPLFLAVQEATEEAVYNSLLSAETVCGAHGRCAEAIPVARVKEICERYGVIGLSKRLPAGRQEMR